MKEILKLITALTVTVAGSILLYQLNENMTSFSEEQRKDQVSVEVMNQHTLTQQLSDIKRLDSELITDDKEEVIEVTEYTPSVNISISDNSEKRNNILLVKSKKKQEEDSDLIDTEDTIQPQLPQIDLTQLPVADNNIYESDISSIYTTSVNNSHIKITDQSVYDAFTEDEVYLICRMVETENHGCCFTSKVHCAETAFARLRDGKWGANMTQIITSPGQFVYSRKNITPDTLAAVNYAYQYQTETENAVMFKIGKQKSWSGYGYILTDPENQSYYGYTTN